MSARCSEVTGKRPTSALPFGDHLWGTARIFFGLMGDPRILNFRGFIPEPITASSVEIYEKGYHSASRSICSGLPSRSAMEISNCSLREAHKDCLAKMFSIVNSSLQ